MSPSSNAKPEVERSADGMAPVPIQAREAPPSQLALSQPENDSFTPRLEPPKNAGRLTRQVAKMPVHAVREAQKLLRSGELAKLAISVANSVARRRAQFKR